MHVACLFFVVLATISTGKGALLLWSKHKLEISPLAEFDEDNLKKLSQKLGDPEINVYVAESSDLPAGLEEVLDGYYKAYNPNGFINNDLINNATVLGNDLGPLKRKMALAESDNVLSIIIIPNRRRKRQEDSDPTSEAATEASEPSSTFASTTFSTTTQYIMPEPYQPPKGPVVYKAKSKKDNTYCLLYSTEPLRLTIKDSQVIYLGPTDSDLITVDTRDSYTRLIINIPVNDAGGKVALRFNFPYQRGYWWLNSVKVETGNSNFNLTIRGEVTAPRDFSYHCTGNTTFTDEEGNELRIRDLQVQIDSRSGGFGDAYDCVPFTTAVIWSGIFVTFILGIGLIFGLTAIMDIRTMDKFDNYKTKQLSITVSE